MLQSWSHSVMFEWHISNHYNVNKGTEQFGRKVLCLNGTLVTITT